MRSAVDRSPAGRLARWIFRRAKVICVAALAFVLGSVALAAQIEIDQELRSLLPDDFPSIVRLNALQQELGQQSDLLITIRSPDRDANLRFAQQIAASLESTEEIAWTLYRRDYQFFEEHALLYASLEELLSLRRKVIEGIRAQTKKEVLRDFTLIEPDDTAPAGSWEDDLEALRDRRKDRLAAQGPYFEADQGKVVVVKARPTQPDTDLAFSQRVASVARQAIEGLRPSAFHPEMSVELDGSYVQHTKRLDELRQSIVQGTLAVLLALGAVVGVYFRSLRAVILVLFPLLVAVTSALAFARLVFGALNLVSAFIFVVLLGLGVDFGIHLLARYRQECRRTPSRPEALRVAFETSGRSIAAGALGTAGAFGFLAFASFQGFAQFGVIAAAGIVLAFVAAIFVVPAATAWLDGVWPWRAKPLAPISRAPHLKVVERRFPWAALGVVVVATLATVFSLFALGRLEFEHDFNALGPRPSEASGRTTYRDAVGKAETVASAVVLAENGEQARSVQRQLDVLLRFEAADLRALVFDSHPEAETAYGRPHDFHPDPEDETDEDLFPFVDDDLLDPKFVELEQLAIRSAKPDPAVLQELRNYGETRLLDMDDRLWSATSIHSFVPDLQAEKLTVLRDIRRRVARASERASAKQRQSLKEWERYLAVDRPIEVRDLPSWLTRQFADASGQVGTFVVIRTRGSKADFANAKRIYDAYFTLHAGGNRIPVAADFFVLPEIMDAISSDGPLVLALAFVMLVLTSFVLFRSAEGVCMVAIGVVLPVLWTCGSMVAFGWKANFFNVIAFPLLIGMAQDDILHLYHRHREEHGQNMARVIKETGGAVLLTTLTTIVGFGGILFANHRGLVSLASVAILGMTLALVAALVLVPSLLRLGSWLRLCCRP